MKKTKLIIEINEEILNNPNDYPEYVFRKAVLNGIPLQTEFEEIDYGLSEPKGENDG